MKWLKKKTKGEVKIEDLAKDGVLTDTDEVLAEGYEVLAKNDEISTEKTETDDSEKDSSNKDGSTKDSSDKDAASENPFVETLSTLLWALGIAFVLRTFLFQPFHIPSGSMLPGLMKGDYIITTKYSLGYGQHAATPLPFPVKKGRLFEREPARGDVIVFRPEGHTKNFIKRLVGQPGDQIQMREGRLHINGKPIQVQKVGQESYYDQSGRKVLAEAWSEAFGKESHVIYDTQKNGPADNTNTYTVPAGHYFMMGDNRDRSGDSRMSISNGGAGYIPTENLMGKAEFVLLSVNDDFALFKPWTWANMRGSRFFKAIK